MKLKFHTLLTLAVTGGLANFAGADLVATDLNDGGTDTGFSGGWAGSNNRMIISAPDLTYPNYGITQKGTVQKVYGGNTTHSDRMDSRNLAAAMTGEIWFSVLVNVPEDGGFAGLSFHSDTVAQSLAYSHNLADLRVVMSPSELWIDWEGAATNASWTPDATVSGFSAGTHLILGQMIVGAGADTLNVWVDPDLTSVANSGDLPAATYSNTTIDFTDSIVRIGVPINVSVKDTADAIWLSDTATAFEDVTGVGTSDTTPPALAAVDPLIPADEATDVPVVTDLVATFDETILLGSGFIRIRESAGDALVEEFDVETSVNLTVNGLSVTINPSSNLAPSTGYYVQIDATAIRDFAGNNFAGIIDTTTWNFTTTSDATAPAVATIDSPANGATEVTINASLVLTFDEDVKAGTGNIVIKRTSDDTVVDTIGVTGGNVTISGGTVTIVPTADLPELTGLYVEIDPGAILDLFDNPFAGISGSATWNFTTGAIPPVLVATDLNDGGIDTGFDGDFYNGSNNVFIIDAPDLTYANYSITQTGSTQRVYASNAGPDRQDLRNLATPMSGEIWFSVLVHVPAGSNYAGLTFNNYGNTFDPITTGARILMGPTQLQVGFNGGAASTGAGTYSSDTTHLLLGQMIVGAGNDTLNVWVDPDVLFGGSLPAADFSESAVDFADSITILGVAGSTGGGSNVFIDAIRMSNTATAFADVAGVAANAAITSFEGAGATGVIDGIAKTIALEVPFGTDLATLAPTFTLSSGTCDQTSGAPPSPSFAVQNPVNYVVTDTSTDPDTVNTYSVTVTVAPETATLVIDLGTSPAGTTIEGGTFIESGPTNLPLPALPGGSILQSIAVDMLLEGTDNDNYASDFSLLLDPTPGTPGGDFSVEITNGTTPLGGAALDLDWPTSANAGIGTNLIDTKTDADWVAAGLIDLATTGLFLGNAYGTAPAGGTWSGTITLTYVVGSGGNTFSDWIALFNVGGQTGLNQDPDGDGIDSGVENYFGTAPDSFSQGLVATAVDTGANTFTFTHPLNDTPADDLTAVYRWSTDLATFYNDGDPNGAGTTTVDFVQGTPSGGMVTVTATITGTVIPDKLFVGVKVTQAE